MPKDRAHDARRVAEYEKLVGKFAFDLAHPRKEEGPDRDKEKVWDMTMAEENHIPASHVKDSKNPMDDAPEGWNRMTPETMDEMSQHYSKGAK